ncbi:MAG: TIGR00153 family protein [Desulfobacteraceae bacterium]|nr:MAG: TIGR00153 family protein [Desulfobacteraceae bacterium]
MFFKFKKEKKVIELVTKHVDTVEECINTGAKTLEVYLSGNIKEAKLLARSVRSIESQADLIRHEIRDKLYSGAYLPRVREDIYKLVESIDKVANAGEACCDFFSNQRPSIPEGLKPQFVAISQQSLGIITSLKLAVNCFLKGECKMDVVREHSKEVGLQESVVDKNEWDLTKAIFTSPSLDFSHKIHLKQCLNTIAEVSDRAEDAADQLELVSLKTMV